LAFIGENQAGFGLTQNPYLAFGSQPLVNRMFRGEEEEKS
jgi:hypothetical protein